MTIKFWWFLTRLSPVTATKIKKICGKHFFCKNLHSIVCSKSEAMITYKIMYPKYLGYVLNWTKLRSPDSLLRTELQGKTALWCLYWLRHVFYILFFRSCNKENIVMYCRVKHLVRSDDHHYIYPSLPAESWQAQWGETHSFLKKHLYILSFESGI